MPRRPRASFLAAIAVASLLVSGCIGATDRADFEDEVRARGGGVSATWIADSIDLVALEVGAPDVDELTAMNVRIDSTGRTVSVMARRNDRPDFVDNVTVREGEVVAVSPLRDADQLPLDEITFVVGDVPIDVIEDIADQALDAFGESDGFVRSIEISLDAGAPQITVHVESARRTGSVVFDTDGTIVGIER